MEYKDNEKFLTEQIITYLGNKRSLLNFIDKAVQIIRNDLKKDKLKTVDIFSGSGIVARYFKKYSSLLITNDLEKYSYMLNSCYLSNKSELEMDSLINDYNFLCKQLKDQLRPGIISKLYAPSDSNNILHGERVFFTTRNALYIDTCRQLI